jgi:hypothetical protein
MAAITATATLTTNVIAVVGFLSSFTIAETFNEEVEKDERQSYGCHLWLVLSHVYKI